MINEKIQKVLKRLIGLLLIIKSYDFITIAIDLYKQIDENKKHAYICTFVGTESPTNFLFPGLYILLFGITLIYYFPILLKTLIYYSLILPVHFLLYFVLFSIVTLDINISLDFFNKIFLFLGMSYSIILISNFNNFDWKNQIKNNYKFPLIIGIIYALAEFYWINY